MNELDTAIYSRLTAGTAITGLLATSTSLYHLQAPEGAACPYVVWNTQGGGDLNQSPHRTKSLLVFIRAYSSVSAKQADSIDKQIDAAFHLSLLTVTGWTNTWLAREQDLETVENPPTGTPIFMQGGLYRERLAK